MASKSRPQHNTEPTKSVLVGRSAVVPHSGAAAFTQAAVPSPAQRVFGSGGGTLWIGHAAARVRAIPVQTPFPHVAVHVVKAPGIRVEITGRGSAIQITGRRRCAIGKGAIEISLEGTEVF